MTFTRCKYRKQTSFQLFLRRCEWNWCLKSCCSAKHPTSRNCRHTRWSCLRAFAKSRTISTVRLSCRKGRSLTRATSLRMAAVSRCASMWRSSRRAFPSMLARCCKITHTGSSLRMVRLIIKTWLSIEVIRLKNHLRNKNRHQMSKHLLSLRSCYSRPKMFTSQLKQRTRR